MPNESTVPKKVLVFGATGVIGKYILAALVEGKSSFDKIGIFTSAETVETKKTEIDQAKSNGVDIVVGDVNSEEDVKRALQDYDTVVSALGRNVILAQIPLLKLAESAPTIHTFYPSEYGTDIEYGPSSVNEKPHQLKLQVRKYIREHVKKLNITYLVTGPYSDLYIGKLGGEAEAAGSFDVHAKKAILLGSGDEKVSFTTMKDVGTLLVAALHTPPSDNPRILKVNSFTTTPNAILAEYERQTNAKWDVAHTGLDRLKDLEEQFWKSEKPFATVFTLRRIWTEGGTLYDARDNGKIGEPKLETLEEQIRKAIERAG